MDIGWLIEIHLVTHTNVTVIVLTFAYRQGMQKTTLLLELLIHIHDSSNAVNDDRFYTLVRVL